MSAILNLYSFKKENLIYHISNQNFMCKFCIKLEGFCIIALLFALLAQGKLSPNRDGVLPLTKISCTPFYGSAVNLLRCRSDFLSDGSAVEYTMKYTTKMVLPTPDRLRSTLMFTRLSP